MMAGELLNTIDEYLAACSARTREELLTCLTVARLGTTLASDSCAPAGTRATLLADFRRHVELATLALQRVLAALPTESRGLLALMTEGNKSSPSDELLAARQRGIRIAMRHPDTYLAATLGDWTDAALAAELGADPAEVWRLRLSQPPRPEHWQDDVEQLALMVGALPERLSALLQRLTVRRAASH
jgi:hypothetical protein